MKHKYRIKTDMHCGYVPQVKRWWFPVWLGVRYACTVSSQDEAEKLINRHRDLRVIWRSK